MRASFVNLTFFTSFERCCRFFFPIHASSLIISPPPITSPPLLHYSQAKDSSNLFATTINNIKDLFDFRATNYFDRSSRRGPGSVCLSATLPNSSRDRERDKDKDRDKEKEKSVRQTWRRRHKDPCKSHCTVRYSAPPHCTALHCTVLHCTALPDGMGCSAVQCSQQPNSFRSHLSDVYTTFLSLILIFSHFPFLPILSLLLSNLLLCLLAYIYLWDGVQCGL